MSLRRFSSIEKSSGEWALCFQASQEHEKLHARVYCGFVFVLFMSGEKKREIGMAQLFMAFISYDICMI